MNRVAIYFLLAGSAGFILTVYFGLSATTIYGGGVRIRGTVTRLEKSEALSSSNSQTWHSVVEFKDSEGKSHETRTAVASFPAEYTVGDLVEVAYLKDNPDEARIVSGTDLFGRTILSSLVTNALFFVGVCVFGATVIIERVRGRRRVAEQ